MVAIIIAIAIIVYVASILILCHNAVPYQSEWDDKRD